jgi:glycosyltransferase involved in cell wall biosynthesis
MRRKKVLFVGSFIDKAKDGSVGGQMFASRSLMASSLSQEVNWILLDTTGRSVPPPPAYVRLFYAILRLLKYTWLLIAKQPDSTLIFSSSGASFYEKGIMAILASFAGVRVILAPRGGPLNKQVEQNRRLRKFVRLVLRRTDKVICQGIYWKEFFSSLLPEGQSDKCVIIPNWIDTSRYALSTGRVQLDDPLRVIYMGWIQEDKGVFDLYNAIRALPQNIGPVDFYFLGDGPARKQLIEQTANETGSFRFFFPGWVYDEEKLNYILQSDVFILASHSEGLPNSLMEAMVCGVASIATHVGAVPDLIKNKETGLMVAKKDVAALSDALHSLLIDEAQRRLYAEKGRELILKNHSINKAVERFKTVL